MTASAAGIDADYNLAGASGNLNLTFTKSGTGVGITKGTPAYKKHGSGTIIKRDCLKISEVKGSVKLTITYGITSKKDAGDRYLEVTVGSDGTTVQTSNPVQSTNPETYTVDIDGGTDGVDVYIGASNETYIAAISITEQQ